MGDYLSPKRKDVVERLRRRIDLYRRHHNGLLSHDDQLMSELYNQTRQDSAILHQRWLESRAKRGAKHSKTKDLSNHQTNQVRRRGPRVFIVVVRVVVLPAVR